MHPPKHFKPEEVTDCLAYFNGSIVDCWQAQGHYFPKFAWDIHCNVFCTWRAGVKEAAGMVVYFTPHENDALWDARSDLDEGFAMEDFNVGEE